MGWSGPGRKRHRAVRTRVGHAGDGGTSLPGWLEGACAFGRSARLRVGSVRFSGPGGPGRRAGGRAAALAIRARRGRQHGSTPYTSIADDSQVDPDRPIKCCDDMHSISHYRPAPAMRGGKALRGAPTIREILTVATSRRCVLTWQRAPHVQVPVLVVTRMESSRYVRGSGLLRDGQVRSGRNEPTCRRKSGWHSTDPVRTHSDAADDVVEKRRKQRRENCRPANRAHGSG